MENELLKIMQNRHSVRVYTGEVIADEKLTAVLQAGLLSASGRGLRPWELIVVRDKEMLKRMSACRDGAAKMLAGADAAIVVVANAELADTWIEDSSIVMANMHLMADCLGLGSCWIQGRMRKTKDGEDTEAYLRGCLGFPEPYRLEAILSLGVPQNHKAKQELADLPLEKIHYERF